MASVGRLPGHEHRPQQGIIGIACARRSSSKTWVLSLAQRRQDPRPPVLKTVATSGEGVAKLAEWLEQRVPRDHEGESREA